MRPFEDFSAEEKKILLLLLSVLLGIWLCLGSATCMASSTPERQPEAVYQITETELSQLESTLAQLKAINTRLQTDLTVQSAEATALAKEVTQLRNELTRLQTMSVQQESSLANANRLLAEYATEAKRERLRIKAQRNTWEAIAACAIVALVVK